MIRHREKYLHNIKLYQPPNVIQHKFKNRNNKLKKILNTNKHMSIEVNDDDQQHIQMVIPVGTPQQDIELNKIINQVLINNRYNTKSTSSLLEQNPTFEVHSKDSSEPLERLTIKEIISKIAPSEDDNLLVINQCEI